MNYTGFVLALQLCMILVSASSDQKSQLFEETVKLKGYFNANHSDVADGGSLFSDILKNWTEESDRRLFLSQIISFYLKLFEIYTDNENIKRSTEYIKNELAISFFNRSKEKFEAFEKLIKIPVNDTRIQQKAIHELFNVIGELLPKTQRKRKRSQNQFRGRRASKF